MSSTVPHAWNEDILILIFDQFRVDPEDPINRPTLAQSALVCRAWYEMAVRALWRTLRRSIYPLYHSLLPFTSFEEDEEVEDEVYLWGQIEKILITKPSSASWHRFLFYASHVREIFQWSPHQNEVRLLSLMVQHNDGRTFLPSLQSVNLSCNVLHATDLSVVLPITMTSLEYFTYSKTFSKDQTEAFVTELAARVPSLTSLTLFFSLARRSILPTLSRRFESLRHLNVEGMFITPEDMTHVWLSNLQSFTGTIGKGFKNCEDVIDMPSLRYLDLRGDGASILRLLSHWRTPSISNLTLIPDEGSFAADLIPRQSVYPALHSFRLVTNGPMTTQTDGEGSTSIPELVQLIAPLLASKELHAVDIRDERHVTLSDAGVLTLAKAWPALRKLWLDLRQGLPSLAALGALARHCPRLEELTMSLHALVLPQLPPADAVSSHPLPLFFANICKWDTDLALPKEVARFVHAQFPNTDVDYGDFMCGYETRYRSQLEEMWKEMRALQGQGSVEADDSHDC